MFFCLQWNWKSIVCILQCFTDKDTAQSLGIQWIDLEVRPVILVCGQLYYVGAARSTMQCGGSQMVFWLAHGSFISASDQTPQYIIWPSFGSRSDWATFDKHTSMSLPESFNSNKFNSLACYIWRCTHWVGCIISFILGKFMRGTPGAFAAGLISYLFQSCSLAASTILILANIIPTGTIQHN